MLVSVVKPPWSVGISIIACIVISKLLSCLSCIKPLSVCNVFFASSLMRKFALLSLDFLKQLFVKAFFAVFSIASAISPSTSKVALAKVLKTSHCAIFFCSASAFLAQPLLSMMTANAIPKIFILKDIVFSLQVFD